MPKCSVRPFFAAISTLPFTPHQPLINTSIIGSFTRCFSAIRQCKCHVVCLFHLPNPGLNVKPESSALMKSSRREDKGGHGKRKRVSVFISKAGAEGA